MYRVLLADDEQIERMALARRLMPVSDFTDQ